MIDLSKLTIEEADAGAVPKIVPGSRVVWSEKGRQMVAHFYNRKLPKEGVFIVEEVIEWPQSQTCVRLQGLRSTTLLENVELAAV